MPLSNKLPDLNGHSGPLYVLLLEDDALFRDRVLVPKLNQFGFEVTTADRATEMHESISKRMPDIILLDVGLPDSNGFDEARKLREQHAGIGIVMLTGRSASEDVVRGLNEGADAYLAKPVEMDVLVATLYSIARRRPSTRIEGATWCLIANGRVLLSPAGGSVKLNETERLLLGVLMKQPNKVISRESLAAALTDDVNGFDHYRLNMLIYRLRRKVLRTVQERLPLDVMHGTGYVMVI